MFILLSYIYWRTNFAVHMYTFFSILTAPLDADLEKEENSLFIMNVSNLVYYQSFKNTKMETTMKHRKWMSQLRIEIKYTLRL